MRLASIGHAVALPFVATETESHSSRQKLPEKLIQPGPEVGSKNPNSSWFSHIFRGFRDIEESLDLEEFAGATEPMEVLDFSPRLIFPPVFPSDVQVFLALNDQNPALPQLWSEFRLPEFWPRRGFHVCLPPSEQPC